MEWWSLRIYYGFRTKATNWRIFVKMVVEWWMLKFFLDRLFSIEFFCVSYTCSSKYSVYDGWCAYTHLLHAHFSVAQFVCAHPHFFMRVTHTHTHGSSVCKKGVVSFLFISPSPFLCFTRLCCSCTPTLTSPSCPHVLAVLTCPISAGHAHLRTRTRSLAVWPSPTSTQVMSPTSSTRSLLWTVRRCSLTVQTSMKSLTSRKTHTRTLDCSVFSKCFESSVSHVSRDVFACQMESKESMHRETDC